MFSEAAGRVEPLPADVILALIDMGLSLNGMEQYAFRNNRHSMPTPAQSTQVKQLSMLAAGSKQHLPHYIPNHLPQFPDPHAYTRTPVSVFFIFISTIESFVLISPRFADSQKTSYRI